MSSINKILYKLSQYKEEKINFILEVRLLYSHLLPRNFLKVTTRIVTTHVLAFLDNIFFFSGSPWNTDLF